MCNKVSPPPLRQFNHPVHRTEDNHTIRHHDRHDEQFEGRGGRKWRENVSFSTTLAGAEVEIETDKGEYDVSDCLDYDSDFLR